jgi:hypothetical protein
LRSLKCERITRPSRIAIFVSPEIAMIRIAGATFQGQRASALDIRAPPD